jgi:polar amino acid transport system substrate-binding protein
MRRILLLAIVLIATSIPWSALAQPEIRSEIAPTGRLRVAMDPSPAAQRVASELGKFIAEKLAIPFDLVPYATASAYTESFGKGEWDIAIGPQTPLVAEKAEFIMDLVLTDYVFLAGPGREFADATQVDRPGVKIGAGANTSSDQFLSRTLKSAVLLRSSGRNIEVLSSGEVDVWDQRLSPGRSQAIGTWWPFRKDDRLQLRARLLRSSRRQKEPVWCKRLLTRQA